MNLIVSLTCVLLIVLQTVHTSEVPETTTQGSFESILAQKILEHASKNDWTGKIHVSAAQPPISDSILTSQRKTSTVDNEIFADQFTKIFDQHFKTDFKRNKPKRQEYNDMPNLELQVPEQKAQSTYYQPQQIPENSQRQFLYYPQPQVSRQQPPLTYYQRQQLPEISQPQFLYYPLLQVPRQQPQLTYQSEPQQFVYYYQPQEPTQYYPQTSQEQFYYIPSQQGMFQFLPQTSQQYNYYPQTISKQFYYLYPKQEFSMPTYYPQNDRQILYDYPIDNTQYSKVDFMNSNNNLLQQDETRMLGLSNNLQFTPQASEQTMFSMQKPYNYQSSSNHFLYYLV